MYGQYIAVMHLKAIFFVTINKCTVILIYSEIVELNLHLVISCYFAYHEINN